MKWEMNQITQEQLNSVASKIDTDFIIKRLCYNLKCTQSELLQYIDKDSINSLLATLLINRGLNNDTNVINAPQNYLLDAHELYGADEAATLINKYVNDKNAHIYVYADYDVDGLTSGYVMTSALREVSKCPVTVKYPDREEGYGLNMDWCKKIVAEHLDEETGEVLTNVLIITVDNGITKIDEVDYLKGNGVEVVITDHHSSKSVIPNCIVVDPHNNTIEQGETFKHLCGCGVAFKVAQLVQELNCANNMYNYFPYLALATIADIMPMHTENLSFILYGLDIINSDECPLGIKALKELEKIDIVTSTTIGWTIAPMLNACGRMGDTELASKLFFTDNEPIVDIVYKIKSINDQRKAITKKAVQELENTVCEDKIFIMNTNKYPSGVLGIVAGKAAEMLNRPAIIVTKTNDNMLHGSSRGINGFDMISLFKILESEELILGFGGHKEAAGVFFEEDKLEDIINRCNELINIIPPTEEEIVNYEETLLIDEILNLENLNVVIMALSNIIPADGRQIKEAMYAITEVDLEVYTEKELTKKKWNKEKKCYEFSISDYDKQFIGKPYRLSQNNPNNIKFKLKQNDCILEIWAWGFGNMYVDELGCPDKVHIAGSISKCFLTKKYVLKVVDIVAA